MTTTDTLQKLVAFYRQVSDNPVDTTEFQILAHCAAFQRLDSEIYQRRSLLQRSWLFEDTGGPRPRPVYRTAGSVKTQIFLKGHIFAVEENPGFHPHYSTEAEKQLMVLSNMRTEWPHIFILGDTSRG